MSWLLKLCEKSLLLGIKHLFVGQINILFLMRTGFQWCWFQTHDEIKLAKNNLGLRYSDIALCNS